MARIALDIDSTLHRAETCHPATARWLEQIGDRLGPHLSRLRESTR